MPVFRSSDQGEILNVRVQDYILKTHVDYLDEHHKKEMKASSLISDQHEVLTVDDELEEGDEEDQEADEIATSTDQSKRTKYQRTAKPSVPGALKEKEATQTSTSSTSSNSTSSTSKNKDMRKARFRYRGYILNALSLNHIDTKQDEQYKQILIDAMQYPSFFRPFSEIDLLYRNASDYAKFHNVPNVQLILGQKSSITKFHLDALNSHSLLVLLSGTKRWFFKFPEDHSKYLKCSVETLT